MNTALVIVCVLVALGSAVFFVYFFGSTAQRRRGPDSFALPTQPDQTLLDRLIAPLENAHPGMSGLQVLPNNMAAFAVRWHSARRAAAASTFNTTTGPPISRGSFFVSNSCMRPTAA